MKAFKFILFVAIFALGLNGAEVSLRAKVSQMIMVGFNGASTKDAAFSCDVKRRWIREIWRCDATWQKRH